MTKSVIGKMNRLLSCYITFRLCSCFMCFTCLFWVCNSMGECPSHNRKVAGSIPVGLRD